MNRAIDDATHTASVPYLGAFRLEAQAEIGENASRFVGRERDADPKSDHFEVRALHALTPVLRRRLLALKSIAHDGLLPILTMLLDGDGPHYITVRPPTSAWASAAPSTTPGIRAALHELCDALAAAHRMGIVHGALLPSHVLRGPRAWWLDLTWTDPVPPAPRAPEVVGAAVPTFAADVWALGTIVRERAKSGDAELDALLAEMTAADPEARPTAAEVVARLDRTHLPTAAHPGAPDRGGAEGGRRHDAGPAELAPESGDIPARLGPYVLLEKLGEGGMGAVFRARSTTGDEGPDVALKVMLPEWGRDRLALARFRREARVLAQLATPNVARFIAAQRDGAYEYMVMEFVEGRSAHWLLKKRGPFPAPAALAIACDIARALVDVHALSLVHRDVKPSNILIAADSDPAVSPRAKLCDFGIVREGSEDAEALTQLGRPGTPSFMSPEQVLGRPLGGASDVYSLGATLYTLLVGVPPYLGDAALVMAAHVRDPIPDIRQKLPQIDPRLAAVIARTLAKSPGDRHPSALALLDELESCRGAEALGIGVLPQAIALTGQPTPYDFSWELSSSPEELWPHVSNTERLNRAIGLDDVDWKHEGEGDGRVRVGSFHAAGMKLEWKENPFEWVAPNRLGVVREYRSGPFEWMRSLVDLAPSPGGGTKLTHRIEIMPRHLFGRAAAMVEIGLRLRRALERTYDRIDRTCVAARNADVVGADRFEAPASLSASVRARLHDALGRSIELGGDATIARALEQWIAVAPPQELGRIRPYGWADERKLPRRPTLDTFLLAASQGVLTMCWDILCPTCRIPSDLHTSLAALKNHGRCEACNLDYEIDLARSVELVFRIHPEIRTPDVGVYCIGGPAHSPHVVAQVRLERGKRFTLDAVLTEGAYVLRGRELPNSYSLVVREGALAAEWALALRDEGSPVVRQIVRPGRVSIAMVNDLSRDAVVRLERAEDRRDVITAADAASSALFRRLFPDEVLAPHELIGVSRVALLLAEIPDASKRYRDEDERAVHQEIVALQMEVARAAELEGGAIVKLQGEGVLAVFTDPVGATRAGMRVVGAMGGGVKAAIHTGTAMLTTINQRLDYFGRHVHATTELLEETEAGELTISEDVQRADRRSVEAVRSGPFTLVAIAQRALLGLRYRLNA